MKKGFFSSRKDNYIDKTLEKLSASSSASTPKVFFVLIVILQLFATFFTSKIAASKEIINFFGIRIALTAFTGVFSSLGNIIIIFLTYLFWKSGYFTSLVLLFIQLPLLAMGMMQRQNPNNIAGLFNNLSTFIVITIIFLNNLRISKYQERMRNQATTDSLTGLPNRFACTILLDNLVKKNERFALVSVDLNNFKSINDTMGHDAGDKMLIEIANRWRDIADTNKTGTNDFIARLGGDEFAFVIRHYSSCLDIVDTINIYEKTLEGKILIDDYDYFITASFGYAEFPDDAMDSSSLFSCADAALHKIKKPDSSSKILKFNPELVNTERNMKIERKIRAALETNDVLFHLQPQYDSEHKLRGFEALARIKDADDTFIRPDIFIPIAERSGLIDRIDLMVFKKAALFLSDMIKKAGKDLDIIFCINVSVRHLMKNNFIEEIKKVLHESGVSANHFEIEITESIMIESFEKAFKYINELKDMGFKVAIDDFGTGYSSLSYLHSFPANLLKIDKSFIDVMSDSDSSKQYVATIISIGHILNLKVISEGVETEAQLSILKDIGCDYIQGYIWGKPMPPEDAEKLITN
ncbi:MAG: bifunctional diguanylate cyclase/phosphodiesterase [Treponema sp.]|nr:bifunctional diguanylate cyclase/phosphodiesterase [Treponema sp.]